MKHLTRQPDKEVGTIPAAFWKGEVKDCIDGVLGLGLHGEAFSVIVNINFFFQFPVDDA